MKQEELNQILENHKHWINRDCQGYESMRADLCGADLCGADLRGANLCGVNLYGANLCEANLYGADLRVANMREADLCGANLCGANLYEANLCGANLYGTNMRRADLCKANLREANLRRADLYGANLCGVNLYGANLCVANMRGANLCGANLCGAHLYEANLREVKNIPHIPLSCPSDGAFIGWKKAMCYTGYVIVKLEISEDAKRSSATGIKCRCDKAKVLGFYDIDGNAASVDMDVWSKYDRRFKYRIGEIVSVSNFDDNRFNECAPGIHFFVDRQSAIDYEG